MAGVSIKCVKVGDAFSTFEDVERAIRNLEQEESITYWRRDTRSFEAAKKRLPNIVNNDKLKYYEVKFTCLKGGRSYKKQSTGARPNQR